jgi:hypothetical protein
VLACLPPSQHAIQYPSYKYQPVRKNANNVTRSAASSPPISTDSAADSKGPSTKNLKRKKSALNLKSRSRVSPYTRAAGKDNGKTSGESRRSSADEGRESTRERDSQIGWSFPTFAGGDGSGMMVEGDGQRIQLTYLQVRIPFAFQSIHESSLTCSSPLPSFILQPHFFQPQSAFIDPTLIDSSPSNPFPSYPAQQSYSQQTSYFELQQQQHTFSAYPTSVHAYNPDDLAQAQLASSSFSMMDDRSLPLQLEGGEFLPVPETEANDLAAMWSLLEDDPVDASLSSNPTLSSANDADPSLLPSTDNKHDADLVQEISYTPMTNGGPESSGWTGVPWTMSLGGDGGGKEVPIDFGFDGFPGMMMDGFDLDPSGGVGEMMGIDQSVFVGDGGGGMAMLGGGEDRVPEGGKGDRPITVAELVAQEWHWQQASGAGGVEEGEEEFTHKDIDISSFIADNNSFEFDPNQAMSDFLAPPPTFPQSPALSTPSILTQSPSRVRSNATSVVPRQQASPAYGRYPTGGSSTLLVKSQGAETPSTPSSTAQSWTTAFPPSLSGGLTSPPLAHTTTRPTPRPSPTISLSARSSASNPNPISSRPSPSSTFPSHHALALVPPLELSAQPGYRKLAMPAPIEHMQYAAAWTSQQQLQRLTFPPLHCAPLSGTTRQHSSSYPQPFPRQPSSATSPSSPQLLFSTHRSRRDSLLLPLIP